MKTINQICIEIDEMKIIPELSNLYGYIKLNKKRYSLVQLNFMLEYLNEKAKSIRNEHLIETFM